MALVATLDIGLDMPFGTIDYSYLDEIVHRALTEAGLPVLSVDVADLRPADSPVDPTGAGGQPGSPFAPLTMPGPFPKPNPGPFGPR